MSGQAMFDRLLIWQVPEKWYRDKKYGGGLIEKAETTVRRHWEEAPRGLILGIGLGALDNLSSNGVAVGHYVHFAVLSPYRRPLDDFESKTLVTCRAGELIDSEDLAEAIDRGVVTVEPVDGVHTLVDAEGKNWVPRLPWMED